MSYEKNTPQLNKNDPDSLYDWIAYKVSCPDFRNTIKDFINDNCFIFIDPKENFFEYEQKFKEFNQLIDNLIKNILHEGKISKEEFLKMVENGRKDIKYQKYFKQLINFKDYDLFKFILYKRNIELSKESESEIKELNKKNKIFVLKTSSEPLKISKNPYAQDCQIEEKTKKRTPIPTDIKITIIEKPEDIRKKDENNTPNCIINSLKEIVIHKIKINISNIEDEDPIMEEADDEASDKNL